MVNLSEKQKLILNLLKSESLEKGYVPSVREICEHVGLKSTSTVHSHLNKLERLGYIKRCPTKPRAITILHNNFQINNTEFFYLPLIKDPTFKNLLDNCNVIENIPVSSSFTTGKHNFLYKNKGNRLNNLGIYDGDYIIVDNNYKFEDSCLYLISLYNEFSCIRKIVKDNDDYKLYTGDDCISISSNNFEIIGKVIGLLKSFK